MSVDVFNPSGTLVLRPAVNFTPREREIAVHVAEGQTSTEIAALLQISAKTVKGHLGSIYAKLGVTGHGIARVTRHAIRQGWIKA